MKMKETYSQRFFSVVGDSVWCFLKYFAIKNILKYLFILILVYKNHKKWLKNITKKTLN
jgi:hypothetical protein